MAMNDFITGLSSLVAGFGESAAHGAAADFAEFQGKLKAEDALRRGQSEADKFSTQAAKMMGSQRATLAAQGIDIDSGSAAAVQSETRGFLAEDVETIKTNAFMEALGFETQGQITAIGERNEAQQTLIVGGMSALGDFSKSFKSRDFKKESTSKDKKQLDARYNFNFDPGSIA